MLNQPIFWNEQEKEYLALIGLKDDVQSDDTNIEEGYKQFVLPFMKQHREYFEYVYLFGYKKRLKKRNSDATTND